MGKFGCGVLVGSMWNVQYHVAQNVQMPSNIFVFIDILTIQLVHNTQ
jgi:hypothetical protein